MQKMTSPKTLVLAALLLISCAIQVVSAAPAKKKVAQASACDFPTDPTLNPDQLAWQIFVAANCGNPGQLAWELWPEQQSVYQQVVGGKRLHGSALTGAKLAATGSNLNFRDGETCNKFSNFPTGGDYTQAGQLVCEEVHINPVAVNYITTHKFNTRPGQQAATSPMNFPVSSIEVKVDWVPASDFNTPFSCDAGKQPTEFYVENIDGVCYAMVGFHISSKLLPNWLWATFEPQSNKTNPLRCSLYGNCKDSWGAIPTTSNQQQIVTQTPQLKALMLSAKLPAAFSNYMLVGSQTTFTNPDGSPTLLGNSITEFSNAGVAPGQASCITCHSYSAINKATGIDNATNLPAYGPIGAQYVIPSGWVNRDFVWSMLLAKAVCADFSAGPLWNNDDAKAKCPTVCSAQQRTWNNQWTTTKEGVESVCGCCVQ
jgi:Mannan-binding protein